MLQSYILTIHSDTSNNIFTQMLLTSCKLGEPKDASLITHSYFEDKFVSAVLDRQGIENRR